MFDGEMIPSIKESVYFVKRKVMEDAIGPEMSCTPQMNAGYGRKILFVNQNFSLIHL